MVIGIPLHYQAFSYRYRLILISDYDLLATQIDKALVKVSENRKRRSCEAAYKQNRCDVEQHHHRLQSQKPATILPPLAAFRELPIIAMLQASPATAETSQVSHVLQTSQWARDQLDVELKKWVEQAKTQLGAILGYPNWKTASKIVLHPCDRVTAWFRCKNCPRLPLKNLTEGCLDFAGACAHECVGLSNTQKRHKKAWNPDQFIRDDKVGQHSDRECFGFSGVLLGECCHVTPTESVRFGRDARGNPPSN